MFSYLPFPLPFASLSRLLASRAISLRATLFVQLDEQKHGSRNLFDGFVYMEKCLTVAREKISDESAAHLRRFDQRQVNCRSIAVIDNKKT